MANLTKADLAAIRSGEIELTKTLVGELVADLEEAREALSRWPHQDYDPPFDGKPCPMCPLEIRNLAATAHNLTVTEYGTERFLHKLQDLRRAVEMVKPLTDAHFADESHAHRPITQWSAAATEEEKADGT